MEDKETPAVEPEKKKPGRPAKTYDYVTLVKGTDGTLAGKAFTFVHGRVYEKAKFDVEFLNRLLKAGKIGECDEDGNVKGKE